MKRALTEATWYKARSPRWAARTPGWLPGGGRGRRRRVFGRAHAYGRMIYDKFAPTVTARTDLKDAITVATRPMVMHGTLTRAPAGEAAGECLRAPEVIAAPTAGMSRRGASRWYRFSAVGIVRASDRLQRPVTKASMGAHSITAPAPTLGWRRLTVHQILSSPQQRLSVAASD